MKVVALRDMFDEDRYNEILNGDEFYGQPFSFTINGELHFPLPVARLLGYRILSSWVKEIKL